MLWSAVRNVGRGKLSGLVRRMFLAAAVVVAMIGSLLFVGPAQAQGVSRSWVGEGMLDIYAGTLTTDTVEPPRGVDSSGYSAGPSVPI